MWVFLVYNFLTAIATSPVQANASSGPTEYNEGQSASLEPTELPLPFQCK